MKISSVLLLLAGVLAGGAASYGWFAHQAASTAAESQPAERKILYYRNPMGQPDTSPVPKKDSMGMDYIPVYADEVNAQPKERKILYYRNPMGQPDTSPVPKKTAWGWIIFRCMPMTRQPKKGWSVLMPAAGRISAWSRWR